MSLGVPQTQTIHKIEGSKPYIHTQIPYTHSFHTCDLLFPFLLSSFLLSSFSSSSSSSFLFSSLLSVFALSFSKIKRGYFFWSCPFYFTFQGGNFLPLSLKPRVSSTKFSSLFHSNIFLLLFFGRLILLLFANQFMIFLQ